MEYHIVYREGPELWSTGRQHQQVHLDRIAVFSTYEEARLYIQMVAIIDWNAFGRGKNGQYYARALPFDLPPEEFEHILCEYTGEGWKLDRHPWHSLFCDPLRFDSNGQPAFGFKWRFTGFETRTESDYYTRFGVKETPQFTAGEVVFVRWNYGPDTYAVITALSSDAGLLRELGSDDIWTGWYEILYMDYMGYLADEHLHITADFEILPVAEPLPQRFKILELLSRHYHGETVFSEEVLNRLTKEPVQVENIESFPFELFGDLETATCPPIETETERAAGPIMIPSRTSLETASEENGLPLQRVFVVIAMFMDNCLSWVDREVFELRAPPAAFTTLEKAVECAQFLCGEFMGQEFDLGSTVTWEVMRERFQDKGALEVDPGSNFAYHHRIQIVEMLMPSETIRDEDLVQSLAFNELVLHTWCFNVDGALLWESPAPELSNFERYAFEGRVKVGDLVYVAPQAIDPESESIEGTIAVVSEVPISKEAWLESGEETESWNPFYTVDFLDPDYFLQFFHVPESSLLLAEFTLPENLAFLPLWSKHLRGDLAFPDGLADRIRAREVLLRRCPRFDFSTGCIVE